MQVQARNYFTGEFCLMGVTVPGVKGDQDFTEGSEVQIMAYDPAKVDAPHSVRLVGSTGIHRVWVGELQLMKDQTKPNQRLPGRPI